MKVFEIELKAYCDNPDKIINNILSADGIFINTENHEDLYFNHPGKDFAVTDEALRLRKIDDKSVITYKGPKLAGFVKTRIEEETGIDDFGKVREILLHLEFKEVLVVNKKRDVYKLNDITICIDYVNGLGVFIELEIMSGNRDWAEKELLLIAEKLGLTIFEKKSYLELLLDKQ